MLNNRLYLSASVLFISAFLVSCQRETDVLTYAPQITAKAEQPATRTVLSVNEDGQGTIYWKPADRISVFFGKTRAQYTSQNKDDATTAVFQTTDSISESNFSSTNIWGLYPSDDSSTCDGSSVTTTLPSQQYGIPETFDDDLFITLAHSNSTTLQFYNVCGGIKFSLSRDDIKSITLRGNNNEDLAGKVKLSFSDGLPKATVVNGVKEITLRPKSGQSFSKGVNYYFVTLPVAMSAGFTMTFTTTGGSVGSLNYTGNSVTLKRSIFSRQKHLDLFASFEGDSQPKNVIYYTSSGGVVVTPNKTDAFGAGIVSNEYVNGKGVITFDADVTGVGTYAFYGCSNLISMELPHSVTSIDDHAFYLCSNLASIDIPDSVTRIGDYAFRSCYNLTSIEIPNSVTSISKTAFNACSGLTSMKVLAGNPVYDSRNNCNAIIETESNTLIAGCRNSVIPSTVLSIGDYAFDGCSNLASIDIPDSVTRIGNSAFSSCHNLTSIEIPSSVKSIARGAFSGCTNLTSIDIPNSVTFIGNEAFFLCSALNSIIIPNSVSSIGNGVFEGCSSLISIVVSSNNSTYDSRNNCNAIIETASSTLIAGCQNTIIPNSVLRIAKQAFRYCNNLTSIEIPNSVTSIGDIAFEGCRDLTSITVFAATPPSVGNGVFNGTNNCPIYVPSESINTYQSAQGWSNYSERFTPLESKGKSNTIYYTSTNGEIITPYQIDGFRANVISNEYEDGKGKLVFDRDLICIGINAFNYCSRLVSIEIPSLVNSISSSAFGNCSNLISIIVNSENPFYDSRSNCNAIIETNSNTLVAGCKNTIIPKSISTIGQTAFNNCTSLTSIEIPNSVTVIEGWAFQSCKKLASIEIPNSITNIGDGVFKNCYSLASITILAEIPPSIGNRVFENTNDCPIYVPNESVDAYKSAAGWSDYADRIQGF